MSTNCPVWYCDCDWRGDPEMFRWRGDPDWWSCMVCDGRVRELRTAEKRDCRTVDVVPSGRGESGGGG